MINKYRLNAKFISTARNSYRFRTVLPRQQTLSISNLNFNFEKRSGESDNKELLSFMKIILYLDIITI